jgi:hypothetical protein
MNLARLALASFAALLLFPTDGLADPPAHAPAHGVRAKRSAPAPSQTGFEIVFDSARGVHVVVGLPGVFFHSGRYYRRLDGAWQVSARADSGWSFAVGASIPSAIVAAYAHPGPARLETR